MNAEALTAKDDIRRCSGTVVNARVCVVIAEVLFARYNDNGCA